VHSGPTPGDPEDFGTVGGGWVPPEARSWRHPSELFASFPSATALPARRLHRAAVLGVGTTAMMAILVGALLLANTGRTHVVVTADTSPPMTTAITHCCQLPASLARGAEESVVSIETAGGGATLGCGVVVGDGLVATTTSALRGARRVRAVAATGRWLGASVLATDAESGVALLRLGASLPSAPATSADVPAVGRGMAAMVVSLTAPTRRDRPLATWSAGTVVAVDTPAPGMSATSMADITLHGPAVPEMPGAALVDEQGRIVGMLDSSHGADRVFLPMGLVESVSSELDTIGRVRHGWLDVTDATPKGALGALVVSVDPSGAAAKVLQPGDVIVRVDDIPVTSSVELRALIYVLPPGARVTVQAVQGRQPVKGVVELAASP
jgi:S1-C subfamily serine protease